MKQKIDEYITCENYRSKLGVEKDVAQSNDCVQEKKLYGVRSLTVTKGFKNVLIIQSSTFKTGSMLQKLLVTLIIVDH